MNRENWNKKEVIEDKVIENKTRNRSHTEETKKKISKTLIGRTLSDEHKKNVSENNARYWLGKEHTEETKKKISKTLIGRTLSDEHKENISKALKDEKNPNWKGGVSSKEQKIRNSYETRKWRKKVFERDNYTCQKCGNKEKNNLSAHHILNINQYPDLNFDVNNGKTLCKTCHREFHNKCGDQYNSKEQMEEFLKNY